MKRMPIIFPILGGLVLGWFLLMALLSAFFTFQRGDSPIAEAHERGVNSFVESQGFGVSRMRRKHLWNDLTVVVDGYRCQRRDIHLIGLSANLEPRYFESSRPPMKEKIATAKHRPLNELESAAVARLRAGEPLVIFSDGSATNGVVGFPTNVIVVRVFGPIKAREECIECHSVPVGAILGVLDYQFARLEVFE
ncbi:MAG: DUF3365 domain-containing protein [Verrucomicrobiae bacterium]|nr:DUF3365 domain-containing protein [Verrucomicrobiae bacterium]